MPRFFVKQEQISDNIVSVTGEDAHHIARSLRMAVGEGITVCDSVGNEYECEIISFADDKEVRAEIKAVGRSAGEPRYHIDLFQALPKGDKLDSIIQKAVECGASEIYLFQSERCVVRIKKENEERKNERRQKIAESAAKQCGRGMIPTVHEAVDFKDMLALATKDDLCLFCYEGKGTRPIGQVLAERLGSSVKTISIIIGSEGGFSEKEASEAEAAGMVPVGLGSRILRTETASGFALACISCMTELC